MSTASRCLLVAALAGAAGLARAGDPEPSYCGSGVHVAEARGFVGFPVGDVFCPFVADPKAMRSFLLYQWGEFPADSGARSVGSIGVADGFPLFRIGGSRSGDGLQLGIEAGVFAQFDLAQRSKDLLNADYLVGLPLTFRRSSFSARLRVYHQSSHLGDELQARSGLVPSGLALEAVELVLSQELGPFRVYAGGEYLVNRTPLVLDRRVAHGGLELRLGPRRGARLIAAVDAKPSEQQAWRPAWSAVAGVEFALWSDPGHPPRLWGVVAQFYDGPSPYGQFLVDHTRYWGWGFQLQL